MTVRTLRPTRVWSTPAYGSPTGRCWWWECRLCGHVTKDLIPSPAIANSDAQAHLASCQEGDDDD